MRGARWALADCVMWFSSGKVVVVLGRERIKVVIWRFCVQAPRLKPQAVARTEKGEPGAGGYVKFLKAARSFLSNQASTLKHTTASMSPGTFWDSFRRCGSD